MGYEVKAFVVTQDGSRLDDGWCSVIAMADLSKPGGGPVLDVIEKYSKIQEALPKSQKPFIYSFGGKEVKVKKDPYDADLTLIPIKEFLQALIENNNGMATSYRRFTMAIGLLESIIYDDGWKYELEKGTLFVLTYGY